jgi:hypothetical protein
VTATTFDDVRASFSPVGPELELAAPGVGIISTVVPTELNGWTHYALLSGTSQAAPHVAGTAALFFAINPSDDNGNGMIHDEVRALLQTTAIDLGTPELDDEYGYGLVNAAALYTCECKGDFDDDLDVDGSDAFLLKEDFGRSDCTDLTPCHGDFDCDQDVDGTNAFLFKEDFGRESCPECIVDDICNYPEE